MKRSLWCSAAAAFGLLTWTAQGQQNNPNPNNNTQPNPNVQVQPNNTQPNPNVQVQPNTNRNNLPNTNVQAPNTNVQAPNTNVQTPNTNVQAPNTSVQAPNTNVQVPNTGAGVQAGAAVGAQAPNATGTMINGRVVRMGQNQYVVQGTNGQDYTFYTNPQTSYWMNNNPAQWSNLQVGSNVSTWYTPQNGQYTVSRVNLYPAGAAFPPPANPIQDTAVAPAPAPVVGTAPAAAGNVAEGQIVRVIGQNQVVIRTSDGKEIIVNVTPQTTYSYNDQPATISTFQPGYPVRVNYYEDNGRPYARGILGIRRR